MTQLHRRESRVKVIAPSYASKHGRRWHTRDCAGASTHEQPIGVVFTFAAEQDGYLRESGNSASVHDEAAVVV
ncbi:MAG: hypothetical protein JO045_04595 [Mycobacterium sp.]|nr:hypothetical protein [Mycobacterium sp.]